MDPEFPAFHTDDDDPVASVRFGGPKGLRFVGDADDGGDVPLKGVEKILFPRGSPDPSTALPDEALSHVAGGGVDDRRFEAVGKGQAAEAAGAEPEFLQALPGDEGVPFEVLLREAEPSVAKGHVQRHRAAGAPVLLAQHGDGETAILHAATVSEKAGFRQVRDGFRLEYIRRC